MCMCMCWVSAGNYLEESFDCYVVNKILRCSAKSFVSLYYNIYQNIQNSNVMPNNTYLPIGLKLN